MTHKMNCHPERSEGSGFDAPARVPGQKSQFLVFLGIVSCLILISASTSRFSAISALPSITINAVNVGFGAPIVGATFTAPVQVTHASDGSGRIFVVQQDGQILIIENGQVLAQPFLDLSSLVVFGGERGLLGLAFHPDYPTTPYFYVNYSRLSDGDTVITRYTITADPDIADPSSASVLLTVDQPDTNHNGGQLLFSPIDGYLYIGMGDGGGSNDQQNLAQNPNTLLGKMLRLDVDGAFPFAVPADNPYVGVSGLDEIWALGLRNPWRFSFDRLTGDLYIGDVGQNAWEEVDFQAAGAAAKACITLISSPAASSSHLPSQSPSTATHWVVQSAGDSCTGGRVSRTCSGATSTAITVPAASGASTRPARLL